MDRQIDEKIATKRETDRQTDSDRYTERKRQRDKEKENPLNAIESVSAELHLIGESLRGSSHAGESELN